MCSPCLCIRLSASDSIRSSQYLVDSFRNLLEFLVFALFKNIAQKPYISLMHHPSTCTNEWHPHSAPLVFPEKAQKVSHNYAQNEAQNDRIS